MKGYIKLALIFSVEDLDEKKKNMTSTTHPSFKHTISGFEVAEAFHEPIRGRTILITGVNLGGFTTAETPVFLI